MQQEEMIKVQATRGVVIGAGQSLRGPRSATPAIGEKGAPNYVPADAGESGEVREIPAETARYLKAIKAVTFVEPAKAATR